MSLKKFAEEDIIRNTMRAYPSVKFFIFDGHVYYNNKPKQAGAFTSNILNVPPGHISLYEYNVDRVSGSTTAPDIIYSYITKDSARTCFKTIGKVSYNNEFELGDTITGSYPLSASITREYMTTPGARRTCTDCGGERSGFHTYLTSAVNPHFFALKNRLNFYGTRSPHYLVTSSYGDKSNQILNLISIPSIFYGTRIKPGSLSLKWYFTGSLVGELRDTKQNGELIQVGPTGSTGSGSIAGVALYDEGFLLLTGSWALNSETIRLISGSTTDVNPKWIYYGAGALDDVNVRTAGDTYASASFNLTFKGQTDTQVVTMFAHAGKGEANYSNNPTYLDYNQKRLRITSSVIFEENPDRTIKNTVSSSFKGYSAPFKRQVFISRVAIYDDNKNLIGIATLSNPILKEEDRDLTFKIKLDI